MEIPEKLKKLLDQKKYSEAEDFLLQMKGYSVELVNFIRGLIYIQPDNPNKSESKAKKYFARSCDSEEPIEDAFIQLSFLEKNRNQARKILRNGLRKFPNSPKIYENIIIRTYRDDSKLIGIFEEVENKGIVSNKIIMSMLNYYLKKNNYKKIVDIIPKYQIKKDRIQENRILSTIRAYAYYKIDNINEALEIFERLASEDIINELNFAPYFGLILCLLERDKGKAFKALEDIPEETEIFPILDISHREECFSLYFCYEDFMLKALNDIEEMAKDNKILGRVKGIRGLFLYNFQQDISSKVVKDLKFADKVFPTNKRFCLSLSEILTDKGNYFEAYKYSVKNIKNEDKNFDFKKRSYDFLEHSNEATLNKITDDLVVRIKTDFFFKEDKISQSLFNNIIEKLYKFKEYSKIIKLSEALGEDEIKKSKVIFEISFSYAELKNSDYAKKYYELLIEKEGITSGVANNLGVIYEKKGDIKNALKFYKKAVELDTKDKTIHDNVERMESEVQKLEKYYKEKIYIKSKILSFYNHKDDEGYIVCPYSLLPKFFKVSETKAMDLLHDFLKKGYILKITNHNLDTKGSVYKINPFLEEELLSLEDEIKKEGELFNIAQEMNLRSFKNLGLSNVLIIKLNKISSQELRRMLKRDLKENVLALITKSYKASLILSGSIIEAVLLDKISNKGITSYRIRNNKRKKYIIRMDLGELLEVAKEEKIIESSFYHLSQVIRDYRNLIHPGVEKRKKATKVNEKNALRAWDIVKEVIFEIL